MAIIHKNMKQHTVLVTGGSGFLGRAVSQRCKNLGHRVLGIGRSQWSAEQAQENGYDVWIDDDVSMESLRTLNERFDCIVHCAGNSSVSYSMTNPFQDFSSSVVSTMELLEYLRETNSNAMLIYPSSAGVYGTKDDAPIKEAEPLIPVSPYGYHKKIVEHLLEMHARFFGRRVAIVRFFSIYGPGSKKQLLWDAATKILNSATEATFWGTGKETRDWIYIDDAVALMLHFFDSSESFIIVNGAAGERVTVREIVELLRKALDRDTRITFTGENRPGDPQFYHADVSKLGSLGVCPSISLSEGIERYAGWVKQIC